jgi:hypothetical protein
MGLSGFFGLERIEVANAVATQATVQTRACGLGAQKLAGDGQQVVQGQQQHFRSSTTIAFFQNWQP